MSIERDYAVVHKDFVLDYTSPLQNAIMEYETGDSDLTYRYTYGLQKENVVVYNIKNGMGSLLQKQDYSTGAQNIVKLYYHQNHLGTTDYLTDNKDGHVRSFAYYDDWGKLTDKTVVRDGGRSLDLVAEYTGHPYDQVLDLYYAKARMYDASDRRFMAVDPVKGAIANPQTIMQYIYCLNNPVIFIDRIGLESVPLRDTATNAGFKVEWNSDDKKAYVHRVSSRGRITNSIEFFVGDANEHCKASHFGLL